jgi:hypothetical protein
VVSEIDSQISYCQVNNLFHWYTLESYLDVALAMKIFQGVVSFGNDQTDISLIIAELKHELVGASRPTYICAIFNNMI